MAVWHSIEDLAMQPRDPSVPSVSLWSVPSMVDAFWCNWRPCRGPLDDGLGGDALSNRAMRAMGRGLTRLTEDSRG